LQGLISGWLHPTSTKSSFHIMDVIKFLFEDVTMTTTLQSNYSSATIPAPVFIVPPKRELKTANYESKTDFATIQAFWDSRDEDGNEIIIDSPIASNQTDSCSQGTLMDVLSYDFNGEQNTTIEMLLEDNNSNDSKNGYHTNKLFNPRNKEKCSPQNYTKKKKEYYDYNDGYYHNKLFSNDDHPFKAIKSHNRMDNTFLELTTKQQIHVLKILASYINTHNHKYSYEESCYYAMTCNSYFGYQIALALFLELMIKDNKEEYIITEFDKIITNQEQTFNLSSLSQLSRRIGFSFKRMILSALRWNYSQGDTAHQIYQQFKVDRLDFSSGIVKKVNLYQASSNPKARSFVYEAITENGESDLCKVSTGTFKTCYGDNYDIIRDAWTSELTQQIRFEAFDNTKAFDVVMDRIMSYVQCKKEEQGYVTPTDINEARKEVKKLVTKREYEEGAYTKTAVINELIKKEIITSDESFRKKVKGRVMRVYN